MWRAGATLCCGAWASYCSGFSCCGARALGAQASVVAACGLSSCGSRALERRLSSRWLTGLAAPRHVGSSQTRDRTHVPCIGRWILNHCTTREVPLCLISTVQQSDSVIHVYILFHYGLSQAIEYSCLCSTVGPCCLSILHVIVCICSSQTPNPSLPHPHCLIKLLMKVIKAKTTIKTDSIKILRIEKT